MILNYLYAFLSGLFPGGILGLTGGGGAILAVPMLVYVVGENVHLAIGTSLVGVGITALISSVSYMKQSLVKFKVAFLMAAPGLVSTYLGALINKQIRGPYMLLTFALLMLYIGYLMITKKTSDKEEIPNDGKVNYPKILTLGFITGLVSGFFGGGGFLLVPALFLGAKLKMKEAVATSLFIIFLFGMFGMGSYIIQGRHFNVLITAIFVAGGAIGGITGAYYAKKINQVWLKRIFSIFIILIGLSIFFENIIKIL